MYVRGNVSKYMIPRNYSTVCIHYPLPTSIYCRMYILLHPVKDLQYVRTVIRSLASIPRYVSSNQAQFIYHGFPLIVQSTVWLRYTCPLHFSTDNSGQAELRAINHYLQPLVGKSFCVHQRWELRKAAISSPVRKGWMDVDIAFTGNQRNRQWVRFSEFIEI